MFVRPSKIRWKRRTMIFMKWRLDLKYWDPFSKMDRFKVECVSSLSLGLQ
jgi:hypothetical protein